jgi:hypothetical protein
MMTYCLDSFSGLYLLRFAVRVVSSMVKLDVRRFERGVMERIDQVLLREGLRVTEGGEEERTIEDEDDEDFDTKELLKR